MSSSERQAVFRLQVTGLPALIILFPFVVAVFGWSRHRYLQSLDHLDEAREEIRISISSRNARAHLQAIEQEGLSPEARRERFAALARDVDVEVNELEARGGPFGGVVFKVAYRVGDQAPGEEETAYFTMGYSPLIGWGTHELYRSHEWAFRLSPWRSEQGRSP